MNKDRRERRKLVKQIRQAEKPQHQNDQPQMPLVAKVEQALGCKFTEWQRNDLNWFDAHPSCSYYLRKPFPGERKAQDIPPPHAWLVLSGFTEEMTIVTTEIVTFPLVESRLVAPEPADGFDYLMSVQETPKGQEALLAIWKDYERWEAENHG